MKIADSVSKRFHDRLNELYEIAKLEVFCMNFVRPKGMLSGLRFDGPHPANPSLIQFGEHWVPSGWDVGAHSHENWELYCQAQGGSSWKVGSEIVEISQGQCYLVSPGFVHSSADFTKGAQHFYFAEWDLNNYLLEDSVLIGKKGFFPIREGRGLESLFRLLIAEGTMQDEGRQGRVLDCLLSLFTLELEREFDVHWVPRQELNLASGTYSVHRAKQLIEHNLSYEWKLEELGRMAGISANYLSAAFSKVFGITPMRYLLHCRLERGKGLLVSTDLSITTIANQLGFSSIQHFSMRFREHTSMSPSHYRMSKRDDVVE